VARAVTVLVETDNRPTLRRTIYLKERKKTTMTVVFLFSRSTYRGTSGFASLSWRSPSGDALV
jgi:hypothetical protein